MVSTFIETLINQLEKFPRLSQSEILQALAESFAIPALKHDLNPWTQFAPDKYTRTPLHRTSRFEVICCGWKPGQFSPIHEHPESISAVRVIAGTALESRYDSRGGYAHLAEQRVHAPGTTYAEAALVHSLGNPADAAEDLITLHVYAPPLQSAADGEFAGGRVIPEAPEADSK